MLDDVRSLNAPLQDRLTIRLPASSGPGHPGGGKGSLSDETLHEEADTPEYPRITVSRAAAFAQGSLPSASGGRPQAAKPSDLGSHLDVLPRLPVHM
jgi:hypothetical protein